MSVSTTVSQPVGGSFTGYMSFSSPPLTLNNYGSNTANYQTPIASGFNFMLPLATVAQFNNQALNFQAANTNQGFGFLNNVISNSNGLLNNALNINTQLNNAAMPMLNNYLQTMGQVQIINAQSAANSASNSGGLFGGGGFLGLGL